MTANVRYEYVSPGVINVKDATGATSQLKFTSTGQIASITDPLNRGTSFTYDANGYLSQITAPGNTIYKYSYDAQGRLLKQTDPLNQTTTFTYGANSKSPLTVTDGKGNKLTYSYDLSGNLTGITYANNQSETFTYDTAGRLTKATERSGDTFTYTYDTAGKLTRKTFKDNTYEAYTYDPKGNLTNLRDVRGGNTQMVYDTNNRLTKITYPDSKFLAYTYDTLGRRTQMKDQSGFTTNYSYDTNGRLKGLTNAAGASIIAYTYDVAGRLTKETNGNGTYTSYSYDTAGQLLKITNYKANNTINSAFEYTYDSLGRQKTAKTADGTWTYTYDTTGQLTRAQLVSTNASIANQDLQYTYDAAGNRTRTVVNGVTTNYGANNQNQYTTVGTGTYTYDADGNLTKVVDGTKTWTYTYNPENKLTKAITPDGTFEYLYDGFGNRSAVIQNGVRTNYLVDPFGLGDVVGEYNSTGGLVANYAHGLGLVGRFNGSTANYYDSDAIGSTVGLTNSAGSYVNRYAYRPFGEDLLKTEGVANGFEYVGQWGVMDEASGLDYMRARFYDNKTGRFGSIDPLITQTGDWYVYAENSPVSYIDPEGAEESAAYGFSRGLSDHTRSLEAASRFAETLDPADLARAEQLDRQGREGITRNAPGFSEELFKMSFEIVKGGKPTSFRDGFGLIPFEMFGDLIKGGRLLDRDKPRNPARYPGDAAGNAGRRVFDPLVLDLDGDGIELVSIEQSTAQFALNADGFREQTGWVKGDDGMLALDANGDGKINNINELFGDALTDGFDELKTLDSNNDKIINASDTKFSQLKIWRDLNQNGITDTGELKTLAETGVQSISLTTADSNVTNEGNLIRTTGKYTKTNGTQSDIVALWFAADRLNTSYDLPYQLKPETLFLPTTRGYGKLPDLYISMSLDTQLLGLMRQFAGLTVQNLDRAYAKIEEVLFRWAKVDSVNPTSRGQYFDARKLGFLESFLQQPITNTFNSALQTLFIRQAWNTVTRAISARLLVQGAMRDLFPNATYSLNNDALTIGEDLTTALNRLSTSLPTGANNVARYWSYGILILDQQTDRFNLTQAAYDNQLKTALTASTERLK